MGDAPLISPLIGLSHYGRVAQVDESGVEQKDIDLVVQQANVSRAKVGSMHAMCNTLYIIERLHTVYT